MSEKILTKAAGGREVSAGDILWVNVDKVMMDDILGPRVQIAEILREFGERIWDAQKVVIISDHYTPPANVKQAEIVKFTRDWAKSHKIDNYYEYIGPCHQIMAERGHVQPGTIVLGTDSHTCMGGAFGAFATGIGSTEMAGVLVTGKTWLKVPETIRITWEGELSPGVMAKDVSLKTIQVIGHSGATYKAIEYGGKTIRDMSMDGRFCITNMAVEMGAKVGLMEVDNKTERFYKEHDVEMVGIPIRADLDASYWCKYDFSAEKLEPQVACPHQVDHVKNVSCLEHIPIHQAYIGSCTGGRYEDLYQAAQLLKGKKIQKGVRLLVSPASDLIWRHAEKTGVLAWLAEAGAVILAPTCGVCVGVHSGLLAAGENCISSSNRNFTGRMGSKEAGIYLASPLTVAASALTGYITDPSLQIKSQG